MQVLLTASDTPLGLALSDFLLERGHSVVPFESDKSWWGSARQAERAVKRTESDLVVDIRMQAATDGGQELNEDDVARVQDLARGCGRLQRPLVHISSAAVFDGSAERGYAETDPVDRVTTAASFLADAEDMVTKDAHQHIILRLGSVLSPAGSNPLVRILERLREGGSVEFADNEWGCPVPSMDAARVVSGVIDQLACGIDPWGIYHYCSLDITTCYQVAELVLATAGQFDSLLVDGAQLERLNDQTRASRRELNCSKIHASFGIKQIPWRAHVVAMIEQIYGRGTGIAAQTETINEQSI